MRPAKRTTSSIGSSGIGDDPDWASWYADWLLNLSELPQILGTTPVRSELVWLLVKLDKAYTKAKPEIPWPQWYALQMVQHFTGTHRLTLSVLGLARPRPRSSECRCFRSKR